MSQHSLIRPEVAARLPAVREQIALGKSWRQIAQTLGLTLGQVEGICHRWLREEWQARQQPREGGPGCNGTRQKPLAEPPLERPRPVVRPAAPPSWVLAPVAPAKQCQWPLEPWRRPWPFCGAPVAAVGCPYCPTHQSMAWVGKGRRLQADAA